MDNLDAHAIITRALSEYTSYVKHASDTLMVKCPFHGDTDPSLGVYMAHGMEIPLGTFNCLGKETLVVTDKGTHKIHRLVGKKTNVIDGNGNWVEVEFQNLGKQKLYELNLTRNSKKKTIYATGEHKWFTKRKKKARTTLELNEGTYIESGKLNLDNSKIEMNTDAICHGFVFGDGTKQKSKHSKRETGTIAYFCSEAKNKMIPFFDYWGEVLEYKDRRMITTCPAGWKELPPLSEACDKYIMGFLAGYFAADGCVSKETGGTTSLSCSNRPTLVKVRALMQKVGISTFPIGEQMRKGYGEIATSIFHMNIVQSTIPESFFLLDHHKENFKAKAKKMDYLRWKVVSVVETNRVEDVYCCEVPTTQSFLLSDNLLTGNCFGCGKKGHWNVLAKKIGAPEIAGWQTNENSSDDFMRNLRKLEENTMGTNQLSLKGLMRGMGSPSHIEWCETTDWREYPGSLIKKVGGRFLIQEHGRSELMLFLPIKIGTAYQGGVKAYLSKAPNRLSYVNTEGTWIRDYGLFPFMYTKKLVEKRKFKFIVLVEGPRDALRLLMQGIPALAILGAKNITEKKVSIINSMGVDHCYSLGDNDEGGETMRNFIDDMCERSSLQCTHLRLPEELDKKGDLIKLDPDDCPEQLIKEVRLFLKRKEGIKKIPKYKGCGEFENKKKLRKKLARKNARKRLAKK